MPILSWRKSIARVYWGIWGHHHPLIVSRSEGWSIVIVKRVLGGRIEIWFLSLLFNLLSALLNSEISLSVRKVPTLKNSLLIKQQSNLYSFLTQQIFSPTKLLFCS